MPTLRICLLISILSVVTSGVWATDTDINLAPVIGILAIPSEYTEYDPSEWNYLAASYPKYIEAAGARVVPVQWDLPHDNLTQILHSLNGFLITGGSSAFADPTNSSKLTPFGQTLEIIINEVIKMNDNGTHFPLWGTCMGFQAIVCIIAGQSSGNYACLRQTEGFVKVSKNISLYNVSREGGMYAELLPEVESALNNQAITYFNAHFLVKPDIWTSNPGLTNNFTLLACTNESSGNGTLPVAIAGKKYPIFASQFHPEKPQFEWVPKQNIPHSYEAILSGQMYATFFVNEARKNFNSFNNTGINIDSLLIGNYDIVELDTASFNYIYFFKRAQSSPTVSIRILASSEMSISEY